MHGGFAGAERVCACAHGTLRRNDVFPAAMCPHLDLVPHKKSPPFDKVHLFLCRTKEIYA